METAIYIYPNRLSKTIDGNVEFIHSQYSFILLHKCQQFYVSDKIINNSDNKELILQ